jgi:TRAP-type C4-dicarboxylate transport system substrate-binding protein
MRFNKLLLVTVLISFFVALSFLSVNAAPIELAYSNFFPATHIQGKLGDSWAKEIEMRTNGRVKITYFPGGALLKGPHIYDGIMKGITDIGMSVFAYTRGRFPAMSAIDLPMGYPSGKVATSVIWEFYNKFEPEELNQVKILYLHAHGPGLIHSKRPIYNLEDIKGVKVRSGGALSKVSKALGAVPVAMPQGQTYEALQKGVAEATMAPIEVLKGWKQGEVIKYTTECYSVGYTSGFYVAMNLKTWNALPKEVQQVFDEVSAQWVPKHGEAWDSSDKAGREFSLSLGNKIIPLSEEESARWARAVEPVVDKYIKDTEAMGLPGFTYINTVRRLIRKYK